MALVAATFASARLARLASMGSMPSARCWRICRARSRASASEKVDVLPSPAVRSLSPTRYLNAQLGVPQRLTWR
jgi:hypothetical protein